MSWVDSERRTRKLNSACSKPMMPCQESRPYVFLSAHVMGHAGAALIGGPEGWAITIKRDIDDWHQFLDPDQSSRRAETLAEILGNWTGREVGLQIRSSIAGNEGTDEIYRKLVEIMCKP